MIHCAATLTITKVTSYSGNILVLVSIHGTINLLVRFKRCLLTVERFVFLNKLWVVRVENVRNVVIIAPLKVSFTFLIFGLRPIYGAVSNLARAGLADLRKIISAWQWRIRFVNQLYVSVIHCLFL